MRISVIDPVGPAIEWTKTVLFKTPFQLETWFVLGFSAWLAQLGQGGAGVQIQFPTSDLGGGPGGPGFEPAKRWLEENLTLVLVSVAVGLAILVALAVLLMWLSSRGRFMFLDGVVRDHPAVKEPWSRLGHPGNSIFKFQVALFLAGGVASLVVIGLAVLVALPSFEARSFTPAAIAALVVGGLLLVALSLAYALIAVFLDDFVVPIMYRRGCLVVEGWREFRRHSAGNGGRLALYVLFKIVLGIGVGVIGGIATCVTCCLAALPYLGTVILLPLHVFMRSYSLYYLAQLDPEYRLLPPEGRPPVAPVIVE